MTLSKRFGDALAMAVTLHAGQTRKGTETPYVSHLIAVAGLVLEDGGDEDEAIAGLFHDSPEDQGGERTLAFLRASFGDRVADVVAECSDTYETPKPAWRARKERFVERIAAASDAAVRVCGADKLHNLRTILADHRVVGDAVWDRFTGGRDGTLWYYRALHDVFAARRPEAMLTRELAATLAELERRAGAG